MQIFGPLAYGVRISSKASLTAAVTLSARVDWGQDSLYYMPSRRCWVDWGGTFCATCQVVAGWIEVRTFCATCQIVAGWIGVGHFVLLDQLVAGWIGVRTVCATHQVLQLPKVLRSIQFLYGALQVVTDDDEQEGDEVGRNGTSSEDDKDCDIFGITTMLHFKQYKVLYSAYCTLCKD